MPPICFPVSGCVCGCVGEYFGEVMKLQSGSHEDLWTKSLVSTVCALFAVGQLLQISYKAAFSFSPKKKKKEKQIHRSFTVGGQEPYFENHFIKMT